MTLSTDIRLCEVRASEQWLKYRAPMKFGGRVVTDAVLLDVEAEVETRGWSARPGPRLDADGQCLGMAQ